MGRSLAEQEVFDRARYLIEDVAQTAVRCGRDPKDVTLMAVTKRVDPARVNAAIDAGIALLGENRVQEFLEKREAYKRDGVKIHFIGTLQTNKIKHLVGKVDMIESVAGEGQLVELERQCVKSNLQLPVLIEVNIGREPQKSGVLPEQLEPFLLLAAQYPHIRVRGLMTIPPAGGQNMEKSGYFEQLNKLFVDIRDKKIDNINMDLLSMGMSADYHAAIACGAHIVRLGTALFGQRQV